MIYIKFPSEKEILRNKLVLGADNVTFDNDSLTLSIYCDFKLILVDTYKHTSMKMSISDIIDFCNSSMSHVIVNFLINYDKAVISRLNCYNPLLNTTLFYQISHFDSDKPKGTIFHRIMH